MDTTAETVGREEISPPARAELDTIDAVVATPRKELDTIDAVEPAPSEPERVAGDDVDDYGELASIERHHYRTVGELAKGGMGRVLEARDRRLGRAVAIKELLPRNRDAARRFEREARITARLQHPAIIHVYEAGVWKGGEPFYVMPKVNGRSLDKVVAEKTTLADRLGLLPHVIDVADALAYAHSERVIHRDLKPANVLLGAYGETVVIDWGLAKDLGAPPDPIESLAMRVVTSAEETGAGSVVGTPAYMPPEQAHGKSVDERADVYALGALLYHVLVGEPPYRGRSGNDVIELVKRASCVPVREREPAVPLDLVAIVDKAMAREPADRYDDASELASDLKRFQTGQLVAARHYTRGQLVRRWLRQYRMPVLIGALAVLVVVAVALFAFRKVLHERDRSEERRNLLLEDRARTALLDGHAGKAAAYLTGTQLTPTSRFQFAEAIRPFEAQVADLVSKGTTAHTVAYGAKHVATVTPEGIQLWSADGKREALLAGLDPGEQTRIVAFDPKGERVAAAGSAGVTRVWKLDGTRVAQLGQHTGPIVDAAWSPDGTRLATASADRTAIVWDVGAHAVVDRLADHLGPVVSVRFSPDGTAFATASEDAGIAGDDPNAPRTFAWRKTIGRPATPLHGGGKGLSSIRWSPDGRVLLAAGADGARAFLVDGRPIGEIPHGGAITSAEFSADGALVVTTGEDHALRIWEVPELPEGSDALVDTLAWKKKGKRAIAGSSTLASATFSPDASLVAAADQEGWAHVWDIEIAQRVAAFEHEGLGDVAFATDGKRLLTSGSDGHARIWDVARGRLTAETHEDIGSELQDLAVAGGLATAVTHDGRRWILRDGARIAGDGDGGLLAVALAPDRSTFVTGGVDAVAHVWAVPAGKKIATDAIPLAHGSTVLALAYRPDGKELAMACEDRTVRIWSTETWTQLRTLRAAQVVRRLAYHPGGKALAGVTRDAELVVWSGDGETARTEPHLTDSALQAIAFSPDGILIAAGGERDTRVFHVDDAGVVDRTHEVVIDGPTDRLSAIAFTADSSFVITGARNGAKLWVAETGRLVGARAPGDERIVSLAVDGDKLWVATEHAVRAWFISLDQRSRDERRDIVDARVPWLLDKDDVVRRIDIDAKH